MQNKPMKNQDHFISYTVTFRTNDRIENFPKHRAVVERELTIQFGSNLISVSDPRITAAVWSKKSQSDGQQTKLLGRLGNAFNSIFGIAEDDE